jgi:urease accessory protein
MRAAADAAAEQRSHGIVTVRVADGGGRARLAEGFHQGSGKLRFPRAEASHVEAMVLNTSGGLTGEDTFSVTGVAEAHALTLTTQACERVYRSPGPAAHVRQMLAVRPAASLRFLPQPTILFEGGHLVRRTTLDIAGSGEATLAEGLVLGREAMGENLENLTVRDRIEVRLDGRLAFVDALRLDPAALARARTPAGLGEARGVGIVVHRGGPDRAFTEAARGALDGASVVAGASVVNGLVVVRILAPSHSALQDGLSRAVTALSGSPPPRAWRL